MGGGRSQSNQETKDELTSAVKEELVFWLERLEKVSSQSIRSEPVTTGSTRVARKCNEINEKRFQCPLLDWEVVKVVPTGSSGPWRWGSVFTWANDNCVNNGHTS